MINAERARFKSKHQKEINKILETIEGNVNTNLAKLIKAIAESSYDDLVEFLIKFAYWVDPGGYCDNEMITDYLFGK